MEKFGVPEPQWILANTEAGRFWRREDNDNDDTSKKCRVSFRCEPDIREFLRGEHELQEIEWPDDMNAPGSFIMCMTCLFCIAISVILPWYIIGGGTTTTPASTATAAGSIL